MQFFICLPSCFFFLTICQLYFRRICQQQDSNFSYVFRLFCMPNIYAPCCVLCNFDAQSCQCKIMPRARRLMKDMSVQNHATCLQIDEGHVSAKSCLFFVSVQASATDFSIVFCVRAPVYTGAFNYLVRRADFLVVQHAFFSSSEAHSLYDPHAFRGSSWFVGAKHVFIKLEL